MRTTALILFTLLFPLISLFGQVQKDSLIVFVGERIEVNYSPGEKKAPLVDTIIKGNDTSFITHDAIIMDNRYLAKYKILQLVHGSFNGDTIEFTVFDHYGKPAFSKYQTVLLFVSRHKGKLYHEKYQFFDLCMTQNGKWASPYSSMDYNHPYKDSITVKPEKIIFQREVSFSISKLSGQDLQTWYPKPYYEIKKGRAVAIYGNYVEDLFKLKQQTILKARGMIHDASKELTTLMIPLSNLEKLISVSLKKLWNLSQIWVSGNLENKRKIHKPLFPEGIYYNVKKHAYLTGKTNMFVGLTNSILMRYEEKKRREFPTLR